MTDESFGIPWEEGEENEEEVADEMRLICGDKKALDKAVNWIREKMTDSETPLGERVDLMNQIVAFIKVKSQERKVPGLKALSAVAVCKSFKESDPYQMGGPPHIINWIGDCEGSLTGCEPTANWCGFCNFARWIKAQGLPKELRGYCKNVLHYLATNCVPDSEFVSAEEDYEYDEHKWLWDLLRDWQTPDAEDTEEMSSDEEPSEDEPNHELEELP